MTKDNGTCFSFGDSPERAMPVEELETIEHGHAQQPLEGSPAVISIVTESDEGCSTVTVETSTMIVTPGSTRKRLNV